MNQAFIDGQNLYFSITNSRPRWKVDLKRFWVYLERKYKVNRAYYFLGYQKDEHAKLYQEIQEAGYILIFRKHNEKMSSVKKGNVDTDIVFEIMRKLADREKFDQVVLVSGDGDYFRMVDYLIKKSKFLRMLAPNERNMSSLYKSLPPTYYAFLNRPEIGAKIGAKKRWKNKAGPA